MLVNTHIPAGRALDFRCETDWRMALRPDASQSVMQQSNTGMQQSWSLPELSSRPMTSQEGSLADVLAEFAVAQETEQSEPRDITQDRNYTGPIYPKCQMKSLPQVCTDRWKREDNPNHASYSDPPPGDPGSRLHKEFAKRKAADGAVSTGSNFPGVRMYFQE